MSWLSKDARDANTSPAHFVESGAPICASLMYRDGPALAPFKCGWRPLLPGARKCRLCTLVLRRRTQ